jgi:hypothetical protein
MFFPGNSPISCSKCIEIWKSATDFYARQLANIRSGNAVSPSYLEKVPQPRPSPSELKLNLPPWPEKFVNSDPEKEFAIQVEIHMRLILPYSHHLSYEFQQKIDTCRKYHDLAKLQMKFSYFLPGRKMPQVQECTCNWYPMKSAMQFCAKCTKLYAEKAAYPSCDLPLEKHLNSDDCGCRPISVIGKFYSVDNIIRESRCEDKTGTIFGIQGIGSYLSLSKTNVGMLQFLKDPEMWTLVINDAWLLGVIEAQHLVYLEVDRYGASKYSELRKPISHSQKKEKNFFKNPLDWVWDLDNKRFRVTGRELCLLLALGYEPYKFAEPSVDSELIFLGLELRDPQKSQTASFEKFRGIMQSWELRGPLPLLKMLASANWFSEEAYQAARKQYVNQSQERSRPNTPY